MSVFFLLTLINTSHAAKGNALNVPVGSSVISLEQYNMLIGIMSAILIPILGATIRFIYNWVMGKDKDITSALQSLSESQAEISKAIHKLEIDLAHMKDGMTTESTVRHIIRDELKYREAVAKRNE